MPVTTTRLLDLVELPPRWREHVTRHQLLVLEVAYGSPDFVALTTLRAQALGPALAQDAIDRYSTLWLIEHRGTPVASLRTTRRRDGPLDLEALLPPALLTTFHDVLGATSRLCWSPTLPHDVRAVPFLVELAWHHALRGGIRLDLIGVDLDRAWLHERLGYLPIPGSHYLSPRDGKPGQVMFLPTDPEHLGPLSDVFAGWPDPVTVTDVHATLLPPAFAPADSDERPPAALRRVPPWLDRVRWGRA